jgi:hypothetical protein
LEWNEIFIHGDPEGLRSLAKILIDLAEVNQDLIDESLTYRRKKIYSINLYK